MEIKVFCKDGEIREIRPTFLSLEYSRANEHIPSGAQFAEDRLMLSDLSNGVKLCRKYYTVEDGLPEFVQKDGGSVAIIPKRDYPYISSVEVDGETVLESDGNGGLVRICDAMETAEQEDAEIWESEEAYVDDEFIG